MSTPFAVPDRRLPFSAVLLDCVAGALAFPVAAVLAAPDMLEGVDTQAALAVLPVALLLLNMLLILINPPEPPVWSVPRAILAGIWRATLLFIALLWALVLTGSAAAVPVGLFVVAWGILAAASAVVRTLRLLLGRRIAV